MGRVSDRVRRLRRGKKSSILKLPNELMLDIGKHLTALVDLRALTLSNKRLQRILGGELYKRDPNLALRAGMRRRELKTVENALLAGAEVDFCPFPLFGPTPLQQAARGGWEDGVRLLLKHGADHGMKTNSRVRSALHLMIASPLPGGNPESYLRIAKAFVDHDADVDRVNENITALFLAARHGDLEMVRFLLDNNAKIKFTGPNHPTRGSALHVAVGTSNKDMVKLLLERGAAVDGRDKRGQTPLSMARKYRKSSIENLLVRYGGAKAVLNHSS
ncbi:ankyrin repeats (3 copies) domain-containing protein [Pochonia chlamydosporia 170]|uniref:Ankyrin repeats (3 copies) domain-containing protein n=1 Tax=Pochonia chlamydosporia 170 TaxID=1380566 RepID=A0A179F0R0_METCM|nr:ankyrin repeats (3 copies) domain-containing protein [Pochonia chlamydosporia 170]OAQ59011.1 ankyrin repeats (3 copies) domain-containing protein [Pochonia chlamydosporia 170]